MELVLTPKDLENFGEQIEVIVDTAFIAGNIFAEHKVEIEDSRKHVADLVEIAVGFIKQHRNADWESVSYIEAIDDYVEAKVKELYNIS